MTPSLLKRIAGAATSGLLTVAIACGVDSSARMPSEPAPLTGRAPFAPGALTASLVNVDGSRTWVVSIDPTVRNSFTFGNSRLDIPANAICRLRDSGYGPALWNAPCARQTTPVTLTVRERAHEDPSSADVDSRAGSDVDSHAVDEIEPQPRIDFEPAMRFDATARVTLYLRNEAIRTRDARTWIIKYCDDFVAAHCIDESRTDKELRTYVDRKAGILFRRIRHLSGYLATS